MLFECLGWSRVHPALNSHLQNCFRIKFSLSPHFHSYIDGLFPIVSTGGFDRSVLEGGPAHAKRFTYSVRVLTTTDGWTEECFGEPMPSVKKAKDSAALILLALLRRNTN